VEFSLSAAWNTSAPARPITATAGPTTSDAEARRLP
jgi:hypothetical protein